MNRRQLVAAVGATVGAVGSTAALGLTVDRGPDPLRIRVFRSARAAGERGLFRSIRALVESTMAYPFWDLSVHDGGVVSLSHERAARAVTSGEWPELVGPGPVVSPASGPAWDVNLLVTTSQMTDSPTGYAVSHVAAVGGAPHLAGFELDATVVPLSPTTFSAHVLLHEIGHALGLAHEHGTLLRRGDVSIATPMLSTYAWSDDYDPTADPCRSEGERDVVDETGSRADPDRASPSVEDRRLRFDFSGCARRELARYARTYLR